jgi:hypothetical protein
MAFLTIAVSSALRRREMPRSGIVLAFALLAGIAGCDNDSANNDNSGANATGTRLEEPVVPADSGDRDGNDSSNDNGNPAEAAQEAAKHPTKVTSGQTLPETP